MLYGNPFYISVPSPVAVIIMTNLIVLVKVTIRLHRSRKHRPMSDVSRVFLEVRITFACNALLGTIWVLAYFAVEEVTIVFQWLFCITNFLQGFFIFLLYTVQNQDVRNAWLRGVGKNSFSKLSQAMALVNTGSNDKKSQKFNSN